MVWSGFEKNRMNWYKNLKFCNCSRCTGDDIDLSCLSHESKIEVPSLFLNSETSLNFVPTISFDTVPIQGVSPDDFDSDEDDGNNDTLYRSTRSLSPSINKIRVADHKSRLGSSSPVRPNTQISQNINSIDATLSDKIRYGPNGRPLRIDYPSKPSITNDSIVINKTHRSWKSLWQDKKNQINERRYKNPEIWFKFPNILFPQEKIGFFDIPMYKVNGDTYDPKTRERMRKVAKIVRTPVGFPSTPRTMLCHISGRQHTWVALDWILTEFSSNLDHIIVVANLPRLNVNNTKSYTSRSPSGSRSRSRSKSACRTRSISPNSKQIEQMSKHMDDNWCSGYKVHEIQRILDNLLDYMVFIIPTHKIVKVSVEIMIGKAKRVIIDSLNCHSPDIIISSTACYKETDSLVEYKSGRLTSLLAYHYPIPVIIVPAKRMFDFEKKIQENIIEKKAVGDLTSKYHPETQIISQDNLEFGTSVDINENTNSKQKHRSELMSPTSQSLIIDHTDDSTDAESIITTSSDSESSDSFGNQSLLVVQRLKNSYRDGILKKFEDLESDNTLTLIEKKIAKLDCILNSSINFNKELQEYDAPSIVALQKIISGAVSPQVYRKKSMLDVLDTNSSNRKKDSTENTTYLNVPKSGSSQIKFAKGVKHNDGRSALQRSKSHESSITTQRSNIIKPTVSNSTTSVPMHQSHSNGTNGRIKEIGSTDSLNSTKKKKGGFFSSWFRGNNNSTLSPTSSRSFKTSSRRNSSGSENSAANSISSVKKKKGLFRL